MFRVLHLITGIIFCVKLHHHRKDLKDRNNSNLSPAEVGNVTRHVTPPTPTPPQSRTAEMGGITPQPQHVELQSVTTPPPQQVAEIGDVTPRPELPAQHAATPQWHPYGVAEMRSVTPRPELPARHAATPQRHSYGVAEMGDDAPHPELPAPG